MLNKFIIVHTIEVVISFVVIRFFTPFFVAVRSPFSVLILRLVFVFVFVVPVPALASPELPLLVQPRPVNAGEVRAELSND